MSGKPTLWMNREDVKVPNDPKLLYESQGVRGILKIPIKQFVVPAENINRFTQTEQGPTYRSSCVESDDKVMYEQTMQQQQQQQAQQQQQQQQAQQHHVTELYSLPKKEDAPKTVEFPFCYNVNMLQKVQQHTAVNTIVGAPIANPNEEKGAYRFDVSQPFSYNYALVNQMSLAAAASTATFKCDICGLVFAHLSLLNHHKRIHTTNQTQTERVFPCDICGSSFAQAVDLKNHKQTAHNNVVKTGKCCSCGIEVDCEHLNKKKSKFLKCVNCEEEQNEREEQFEGTQEVGTETDDGLKTVQPGAHPVKRRGMATVTKCHKCNGTGILFVGGVQPTVEKPFHCNICEGTFSRYSSLWSHKRLHTGDKPFKCEFCGLAFARAAYLKNHSRIHSGERPFKCDVCGMQFSQAPHLKNHERIHSGERPYECEICNKTFARHSTLWNHRRIHTGEKPYRCSVCGSAFNQATHLKNHQKVHTGEKPHRCDICEVGFSDRFALKRHRGIHEKYGQTASQQQAVPPQPAQQVSQEQQTVGRLEELYKCDVTAGIAFPGCSRPQEAK